MADKTKIEWADATVNAINGCSVTSPGCTHCYAMKLAGTRLRNHPTRKGLTIETKAGPVWNGEVRLNEPALLQPLSWTKPRCIFWNAHGDPFHENVPDAWIDRVFATAALTPWHTHMILTKRSKRMREYLSAHRASRRIARGIIDMLIYKQVKYDEQTWPVISEGDVDAPSDVLIRWPLPNVWLGVSVEDQTRADERIPDLFATPATVRFLSCEPLLRPVDIEQWLHDSTCNEWPGTCICTEPREVRIDWVIAGGESGPAARPMHPDWARSLRDQCAAAGVPFHFKQWGNWAPVCEMNEQLLEDIYHPTPAHSPEASRRCKVDQCVLHADGTRFNGKQMYEREAFWQGKRAMTMFEVGKKRAGRLLDGVEHNGMPEVRL